MVKKKGASTEKSRVPENSSDESISMLNDRILFLKKELLEKQKELEAKDQVLQAQIEELSSKNEELENRAKERKRAEEAVKFANTYNRSLIEASLDPLVTISPDGVITDVNKATEAVTGYSRDDLIGTDFSSYFTDPEKAKEGYLTVFKQGSVKDYPLEIRRRDGHLTPVIYNASIYRDESGKVVGVFAAARDITERKRAEEAIKLANAYNRSLIEVSLDPLVTISPDGRITDVNKATEKVTGLSRDQLIGTDFSNYFTEPEKAREGYLKAFKACSVTDYPLEIMHKDGHVTPVIYNASVYRNEAGDVIGVFAAARDITEQKKIEEARSRLAAIVNSSDDAIIGKTLDGVITSWNAGAMRLYGYKEEEVVGKSILILAIPDYPEDIPHILNKIRCGEHINYYETMRKRKDGRIINVSLSVSPIKDSRGRLVGASTITRDITEKKRAEEAIRLAGAYNRSLIEASLDPLVTISPDGVITDVNKATEAVTGYSRDKLIGTDFSDYFTEPEKAKEGYLTVFKLGSVTDYPLEIRRRDGNITPVIYNASVYRDESGKVIGVFAAARNITERKKVERALLKSRAILARAQDIAHVGNWAWNLKTNSMQWSDEMFKIFGYKPQELQPTYEWLLTRVFPDDRELLTRSVSAAVHENKLFNIDYRIIMPDGSIHYMNIVADRIKKDKAGAPEWMYGIIQDITSRKKVENELRDAQAQAELYVDLMGHDINNMNMVALGFLEMACNKLELEGKLDRNDKMLIMKPVGNLENSSRLIDNVRKLQREKAGELKMKAIDVGEVLSSVKDQYLAVPDRDVKINLNATCRCAVMANELLRDVFSNLVGNAVKHSSGALTINIDLSCPQEGDMHFCKVAVEDNGPGIPDALKAVIFRRSHLGKKWQGRGLGLYLVNTLVGDFHGTVWVEDRVPGDYTKGARFVVMIPALK